MILFLSLADQVAQAGFPGFSRCKAANLLVLRSWPLWLLFRKALTLELTILEAGQRGLRVVTCVLHFLTAARDDFLGGVPHLRVTTFHGFSDDAVRVLSAIPFQKCLICLLTKIANVEPIRHGIHNLRLLHDVRHF